MVIIKTMDKSTLKIKINYKSNHQSDINTDLSNISNPNNEWNKVLIDATIDMVKRLLK